MILNFFIKTVLASTTPAFTLPPTMGDDLMAQVGALLNEGGFGALIAKIGGVLLVVLCLGLIIDYFRGR